MDIRDYGKKVSLKIFAEQIGILEISYDVILKEKKERKKLLKKFDHFDFLDYKKINDQFLKMFFTI